MPTREQYEAAFEAERRNEYPVIDEFERRMGFAVDRERLEAAARVLACPVKRNPPNWQHGRVVYALARKKLHSTRGNPTYLDIGTAKGFSAVCMAWASMDEGPGAFITSVDVIEPESTEPRNSIMDGNIRFGLCDYLDPFRDGYPIDFMAIGDAEWERFKAGTDRIHFAFIDGSHTYEGVKADIAVVAPRQRSGDIILFDDVNKEQINRAVREMAGYDLEYIKVLPQRAYAIAVKQ
jgi:hypothetical protein